MATPTYDLIDSQVLGSSASEVTFSSIPGDWRDLILVVTKVKAVNSVAPSLRFNGDTGTNYSRVSMQGRAGNQAVSNSGTLNTLALNSDDSVGAGGDATYIIQILDYAQTDKHKSLLSRSGQYTTQTNFVYALAGRWASTSAITSVTFRTFTDAFAAGVTFHLYGIAG